MRRPARSAAVLALAATLVIGAASSAAASSSSPTSSPSPAVATGPAEPVGGPAMGTTGTVVSPGASRLPKVGAASWIVADATTGTVLAAKVPHLRHRPASTLKTLTALALLPQLDKQHVYTAVWADAAAEGSRAGVVEKGTYTVDQLLTGMFLPSGNDCAIALAHVAGGVGPTVGLMRDTATKLQARDTTPVNPSGLDADGQLSSAYDLALFFRAGLQRQDFREYIGMRSADFPGRPVPAGKVRKTFKIYNTDRLLQRGYVGMIGGKTGYTTLAGRTFVGAAQRGPHTIVVALMGITVPTADGARTLLDWGLRNADAPGIGTLVDPLPDEPTPGQAAEAASASPSSRALSAGVDGSGPGGTRVVGGALLVVGLAGLGGLLAARRRRDPQP